MLQVCSAILYAMNKILKNKIWAEELMASSVEAWKVSAVIMFSLFSTYSRSLASLQFQVNLKVVYCESIFFHPCHVPKYKKLIGILVSQVVSDVPQSHNIAMFHT